MTRAAALRPLDLSPTALAVGRRRARATLVTGVALGSTGHIAAVTVATLVAQDLLGSSTFAGAPGATVVLGAALGAVLLSALMSQRGRRAGLSLGYAVGVGGALLATTAVLTRSFPLLLLGTLFIGFGNSSNQLSRYASSDMAPAAKRASAIGLVVWASTVGSVIGPWLVPIAGAMAVAAGLPLLAGPYLVPVLFVGTAAIASFVFLRPDPYELADVDSVTPEDARVSHDPVRTILRRPGVGAAIVALIAGQFVMTLIMTMTPLHMTQHGHDLGAVGLVLSGHTLGMFALSPLSGRLTEQIGSVRTILIGSAVLGISAVMAAVAPPDGGVILFVALFLLGYGWNLGFVAGSTMLSERLEIHERTHVQGIADSLIWSAAAAASLGSGIVMAMAGYTALAILGMGAVVVMAAVMRNYRRDVARQRRRGEASAAELLDVEGEASLMDPGRS